MTYSWLTNNELNYSSLSNQRLQDTYQIPFICQVCLKFSKTIHPLLWVQQGLLFFFVSGRLSTCNNQGFQWIKQSLEMYLRIAQDLVLHHEADLSGEQLLLGNAPCKRLRHALIEARNQLVLNSRLQMAMLQFRILHQLIAYWGSWIWPVRSGYPPSAFPEVQICAGWGWTRRAGTYLPAGLSPMICHASRQG